jgi:hypothetical protein
LCLRPISVLGKLVILIFPVRVRFFLADMLQVNGRCPMFSELAIHGLRKVRRGISVDSHSMILGSAVVTAIHSASW